MPLETLVHCQADNAQNGQWISGQASAQGFRQPLGNHFARGDGYEAGDLVALGGYIGGADVMTELVLPGIALKEAIEVDIPATKPRFDTAVKIAGIRVIAKLGGIAFRLSTLRSQNNPRPSPQA